MGLFGQRTTEQLKQNQGAKAQEAAKEFERNARAMMLEYLPLPASALREKEARYRASYDNAMARWEQTKAKADYEAALNAAWYRAMLNEVFSLRRKMVSAGWQEPQ